jgi:L-ribulose-5-phosphate 3-epimerase
MNPLEDRDLKALCSRRSFIQSALAVGSGAMLAQSNAVSLLAAEPKPLFKISLGEWSFHRALFEKKMNHLDVAKVTKHDCGIDALEYSAQFFMDKAEDKKYLTELKTRAADEGVTPVLITVDSQGNIGDPDEKLRLAAVENHRQWITAGKTLGCQTIRVNAFSDDKLSPDEQAKLVADGLQRLAEIGAEHGINVIIENHGHLSSNGKWVAKIIQLVDLPNCGTLPDFGNFPTQPGEAYDRYQGVAEMMPFAKGVSAKSYGFDAQGNETTIDYRKMVKIVLDAGFHGYLGIEFEGDKLSEVDGVLATKKLLENIRRDMA